MSKELGKCLWVHTFSSAQKQNPSCSCGGGELKDGFQRPGSCTLLLFSSQLGTQGWPRAKSNKESSPWRWRGQCPSHQPWELAEAPIGDQLSMETAAVNRAEDSSVSWGCVSALSRGKSNCRGAGLTRSVGLMQIWSVGTAPQSQK